jgi:hypothetical protein
MPDSTDLTQIVRDLRRIKMGVRLVIGVGVLLLAANIFLFIKLPSLISAAVRTTEPPIRVRGGSLHFDLLSGGSHWKPTHGGNADTDWTLEPGYRNGDNVRLWLSGIVPTQNCTILQTVKKVTFSYKSNDGRITNEVTLHAAGNKTTVHANSPIELQPDGNLAFDLDHPGYISAIKGTGGGAPMSCTFPDGNALSDVTATEY